MKETYTLAYLGILIALTTLVTQSLIAATTKASQKGAVPGKIDKDLSHSSFVFRAHRTFMNSLENFPAFLGAALLAVMTGANVIWVNALVLTFAAARIVHMTLYYAIATEKNPSPRSYFYLIGMASTIGLLVLCAMALI
ncbi:MAPEG family protein [Marinicella sp. S1101]|uniref:MAPEG family protein n=1 Tax=Marinicella marina TaxID=2996016 RepID=UPI002260DC02|nr:MAPEG family protein [Marinicella marina]MCX7552361.1 MAPEG family protein [Marinicella marina]MDJ1139236.1 MAPEG family protein [Marinicella marina]